MNKLVWGVALGSALLTGGLMVRAADEPTTKPAKHEHATTKPSQLRLEPYSQLTDLTDDEKAKITEIHKKELADAKVLEAKEDEDIRAILTDDQKAELDKIAAEKKDKMKEKNKERMHGGKAAASQPAN